MGVLTNDCLILHKEQLDFYDENGFLIIKNLILSEKLNQVNDLIAYVIKLESDKNNILSSDSNELLHKIMIKLKKNTASSSWIYQTINCSNIFKKFIHSVSLDEIAKQLLHLDSIQSLGTNSSSLRIDVPHDKKNIRDWHQDSHYFLDNKNASDSLVVWIPFDDVEEKNGAVLICPKSHREGRLESVHVEATYGISEQYITDSKKVEKYEQIIANCKKGDTIFFNMDLIHKSGVNSSDEVRYTAQIRYTSLNKPGFRPPTDSFSYTN